jgi:hypothetical protein
MSEKEDRPGFGTDYRGAAVLDPTENVKALNEAAFKALTDALTGSDRRQDDLRIAAADLARLHFDMNERAAALRDGHMKELMSLRSEYEERLSRAEASRIDAIRSVDVQAVLVASQRASDQATVLQNQVNTSAEALRTLVASTATTFAQNLQQTVGGLSTRLTTLEQGSYQAAGKQQYADPEIARLVAEVRALNEQARATASKGEGIGASWGVIAVIAGLLIGGLGLFAAFQRPGTPVTPQVVYLPAPAAAGAIVAAPKP